MAKKKNWELVKYHKSFGAVPWISLSAFEADILAIMLTTVRNRKADVVTISIKQVEKLTGRRMHKELLKGQMKRMADKLTSIKAPLTMEGVSGILVVFPTIRYEEEVEEISIRINPDYLYMFNDVRNYFTWSLIEHISLPTAYSKSLYRYLSHFKDKGEWLVSVDDFRWMLDVPDKYDNRRMMDKVVMPAAKHLQSILPEKFEDLKVEKIKEGTKIAFLKFTFPSFETTQEIPETSGLCWDDGEPW